MMRRRIYCNSGKDAGARVRKRLMGKMSTGMRAPSEGNISFMTFRAFMGLKDKFENISGKP